MAQSFTPLSTSIRYAPMRMGPGAASTQPPASATPSPVVCSLLLPLWEPMTPGPHMWEALAALLKRAAAKPADPEMNLMRFRSIMHALVGVLQATAPCVGAVPRPAAQCSGADATTSVSAGGGSGSAAMLEAAVAHELVLGVNDPERLRPLSPLQLVSASLPAAPTPLSTAPRAAQLAAASYVLNILLRLVTQPGTFGTDCSLALALDTDALAVLLHTAQANGETLASSDRSGGADVSPPLRPDIGGEAFIVLSHVLGHVDMSGCRYATAVLGSLMFLNVPVGGTGGRDAIPLAAIGSSDVTKSASAMSALADASRKCYAAVCTAIGPLIATCIIRPTSSFRLLVALQCLHYLALVSENAPLLDALVDGDVLQAICGFLIDTPRSELQTVQAGLLTVWRDYLQPVPGSREDMAARSVPTLFDPLCDLRDPQAYLGCLNPSDAVIARERRQRIEMCGNQPPPKRQRREGEEAGLHSTTATATGASAVEDGVATTYTAAVQRRKMHSLMSALHRRDMGMFALSSLCGLKNTSIPVRVTRHPEMLTRVVRTLDTCIGSQDIHVSTTEVLSHLSNNDATMHALLPHIGFLLSSAAWLPRVSAPIMKVLRRIGLIAALQGGSDTPQPTHTATTAHAPTPIPARTVSAALPLTNVADRGELSASNGTLHHSSATTAPPMHSLPAQHPLPLSEPPATPVTAPASLPAPLVARHGDSAGTPQGQNQPGSLPVAPVLEHCAGPVEGVIGTVGASNTSLGV